MSKKMKEKVYFKDYFGIKDFNMFEEAEFWYVMSIWYVKRSFQE